MKKNKALAVPFVLWAVLFIAVPLAMVVWYGVTVEETPAYVEVAGDNGQTLFQLEDGTVTAERPQKRTVVSLANFRRMLEPTYLKLLLRSLKIALFTTIICLLLGYPAALIMADREIKLGPTLVVLFIIPMWMNFLLRTIAWMSLLEDNGLINTVLRALGFNGVQLMYNSGAVLLGMVYNFLPFMVFPIYTLLSKMDYRLTEAAADLGCNNWQTLWKVTMPLSIPGIVSGITMVFMPSVTTFFIPRVLGGGNTMMFGDLIEAKFLTEGNWNVGSALSLIMMVLILISLSILRKADPNGEGGGIA